MVTRRTTEDYVETISPQGYVNNREITNLPGHFLVKGSINTRIVNKEKVVTSKRYTLKGAAKTLNRGIVSSFDWKTNTGDYRNIRCYKNGLGEIEVWFQNAWRRVKRAYQSVNFEWAPYWLSSELLDVLIGVRGDDKLYMWSGGIAEVASVTANSITKKGYITGTTFSFDEATRTITDSANGFLTAGFAAGDEIEVAGTDTNDGFFVIESVTAGAIVVEAVDLMLTEAAGDTVIIKWKNGGTWAQSRFLVSTTGRAVLIGGIVYTYTGGHNTGTLTGLVVSPVANGVTAGDIAMQDFIEYEPSELDGRRNDLVGVMNNHLYVASYTSRTALISSNTSFVDFTYTTPLRAPGEGFSMTIDATPTALVPSEDEMYISAGDNDWYKVYMEFSSDQGGEAVIIRKLKTAPGQAAVNQGAVAFIKNNIAYLSVERTIDTLGNIENVEGTQNRAISDDIRDDMEAYDITGAHMLYFRRSLFIALPAEDLVLEYDIRFGYWQPPQIFPIGRLAIIDDRLCGHSRSSNETYILYEGYNDNGASYRAVAAFGYENFGTRFGLKNFTEVGVEAYMSRNTVMKERILYEYLGAADIREFLIDGNDDAITFSPNTSAGLGQNPLGNQPLGSSTEEITELVKVRAIDTTSPLDFFERQRVFEAEGPDIQFEIIAFGENVKESDNEPSFIKR